MPIDRRRLTADQRQDNRQNQKREQPAKKRRRALGTSPGLAADRDFAFCHEIDPSAAPAARGLGTSFHGAARQELAICWSFQACATARLRRCRTGAGESPDLALIAVVRERRTERVIDAPVISPSSKAPAVGVADASDFWS